MARSLARAVRNDLREQFYPLAIAGTTAVLVAAYLYLPARFVVYGLYGLFGLLGGAVMYYRQNEEAEGGWGAETILGWDETERSYGVEVAVAGLVSVGVVALTGEALFVVVGLGVGYALVLRQLVGRPEPTAVVPQLSLLFLLSPVAKYLTAGRYVGHSDIVRHTRLVDDILAGGSLDAIGYASYQGFPGLHLVASTVASLTGVPAYDGLMLLTLAAHVIVVPAVYLVTARLTDSTVLALLTAFGVALLDDLSFYVSYAFPQSLATVLFLVLLVLAAVAERGSWPAVGGFLVVAVAVSYVHHLTQLLFVPVVLSVAAAYALVGRVSPGGLLRRRVTGLLGLALVINGVRIWQTDFLGRLVGPAGQILQGGPLGGYSQGVTATFGAGGQSSAFATALQWLASPYALYGVLLLTVFSLGVVSLLRARGLDPGYAAIAWVGVAGAVLIFETPLSIPSLIRIRAPWLFAFAFVVGLGCYQLRRRFSSAGTARLAFVALLVLATVSPLVTADNYYGLDPRPTAQTSFSEQEYSELRATASFVDESETPTTTFWLTRLAMERFEVEPPQRVAVSDGQVVIPAGHYVYRSAWTDHEVSFTAGTDSVYDNTLSVSEPWLTRRVGYGNQVYTAGGTGVLWSPSDRTLGMGPTNESRQVQSS